MAESSIMASLMGVIAERKARASTESSYVAGLMQGGTAAICAKIIEEAAEVVEASDDPGDAGRDNLIKEVADLVFHTAVLLGHRDIGWEAVEDELRRRFGTSGLTEKASRPPKA